MVLVYGLSILVLVSTITFEVLVLTDKFVFDFSFLWWYYIFLCPIMLFAYIFSVYKLCYFLGKGSAQWIEALKPERTRMAW